MTQSTRNASDAPMADWYFVYEFERRAYAVDESLSIGRNSTSDVVVLEPNVSRVHARITLSDGVCVVENVGATGTRVNGTRIEGPQPLNEGDRVEVGMAALTLRRPPLPLGVSIVDRVQPREADPVVSRRATVRNPLLIEHRHEPPPRRSWLIGALVLGAIGFLVLLRAMT